MIEINEQIIFPTALVHHKVDDSILENTKELVYEYMQTEQWIKTEQQIGHTKTSYHHDEERNFLGKIGAYPLMQVINDMGCEYMKVLGLDPDIPFNIQTWFNENTPGTFHEIHEHYGAFIGGTFYITVPESSGDIVFYDPVKTRVANNIYTRKWYKKTTEFNTENHNITPKDGDLLMFEAWMPHSVLMNKSDKSRLSVSFNIGPPNGYTAG